ncbi:unnamed protein product [Victoria cruziana]
MSTEGDSKVEVETEASLPFQDDDACPAGRRARSMVFHRGRCPPEEIARSTMRREQVRHFTATMHNWLGGEQGRGFSIEGDVCREKVEEIARNTKLPDTEARI